MALFTKVGGFVHHLAQGVHDLDSDQLTLALSNTAPDAETTDPTVLTANCYLTNVTEISYTGLSSRDLTLTSSTQSGGVYSYVTADISLTASGTIPTFRYIYVYNSTAANGPIIGYWDYGGSGVDLVSGQSLDIDIGSTGNVLFTLE